MVDTVLRPRPMFSTFLQSDTNAGGDGLTYYDYQRLLRSQKVAILQERRVKSYVPGYKKTEGPISRKIFQLSAARSPVAATVGGTIGSNDVKQVMFTKECHNLTASSNETKEEYELLTPEPQANGTMIYTKHVNAYSERLPNIPKHRRLVKSATARTSQHHTWSGPLPEPELRRPKTACSSKDAEMQTKESK